MGGAGIGGTEELASLVGRRLADVRDRIAAAGGVDVEVVAVTKGHPVEVSLAAVAAGCTVLGENYAQELAAKAGDPRFGAPSGSPSWTAPPTWHFIGQLQSNKVRTVVRWADTICSVDRSSLITEIARRAPGHRVMVQVNLDPLDPDRGAGGGAGRGGAAPADVPALVAAAVEAGLDVRGLMGVAPIAGVSEVVRAFRVQRTLVDSLGLRHCSMGMSDDFEVAVAEGSTMVRLGSVLFGPRS